MDFKRKSALLTRIDQATQLTVGRSTVGKQPNGSNAILGSVRFDGKVGIRTVFLKPRLDRLRPPFYDNVQMNVVRSRIIRLYTLLRYRRG
ncbi:hypothetical protein CA233_17880 [Sphingomonas sp. ABOLD]|nr:hypothetical protein CA233_17880 [Sphingomonas sp. ABOLD]